MLFGVLFVYLFLLLFSFVLLGRISHSQKPEEEARGSAPTQPHSLETGELGPQSESPTGLHPCHLWDHIDMATPRFLYECWRLEHRSSCMSSKCSNMLNHHLPAPPQHFFLYSYSIAQGDFKFVASSCLSFLESWDYRHELPPHLA